MLPFHCQQHPTPIYRHIQVMINSFAHINIPSIYYLIQYSLPLCSYKLKMVIHTLPFNFPPFEHVHISLSTTSQAKWQAHPTNAKVLCLHKYTNTLPSSTSQCTVVDIYNNSAQPHTPVQIALILTPLSKQFVINLICPNPMSLNPTPSHANSKIITQITPCKLRKTALHCSPF